MCLHRLAAPNLFLGCQCAVRHLCAFGDLRPAAPGHGPSLTLHPASLGWGPGCAVKGPTESSVALELCEHILADGFDCNNNRLLVTQPADLVAQREDLSDCVTSESRSACPACAGAESTGPAQYEPSYRFAGLLQGQGASIRPAGAAGPCPSARIRQPAGGHKTCCSIVAALHVLRLTSVGGRSILVCGTPALASRVTECTCRARRRSS